MTRLTPRSGVPQ